MTAQDHTTTTLRARVEELLAQMTLGREGRAAHPVLLLRLPEVEDADGRTRSAAAADEVEAALARGGAGSLLFVTDPAETNRLQRLAVEGSRHGIPALFGFDVIHGLRTVLPVPIAHGRLLGPGRPSSAGQAVAAREARAVGIHWTFAPMVDIARDPRWGRIVEGAGEDPFLGSAVAAAQVRGFQGERLGSPERVIAGPKHFAGYGAALGGRDYDEVDLSDARALERLPAAVQGRRRRRRGQHHDRVHGRSTASRRRPTRGCSRRCCAGSGASRGSS